MPGSSVTSHKLQETELRVRSYHPNAEFMGPRISTQQAIWRKLTDFPRWVNWLPDFDQLESSNCDSEIGRGSKYGFIGPSGKSQLEVMYWLEPSEIVIKLDSHGIVCAYRFVLSQHHKQDIVRLVASGETTIIGWRKIMSPIVVAQENKRLSILIANLGKLIELA